MFKSILKDIAARNAIARLTDSMLGRALIGKLVSMASKQLGIPLEAKPCDTMPGFWQIKAGAPGADMLVECRIRTATLAELLELAAHAWLEDRPLDAQTLQSLLLSALRAKGSAPAKE